MSKRRVVITGMGTVSPVGNTVAEAWKNVVEGRSGIGPIERFDVSAFPTRIGGEVRDFDPADFIDRKQVRKTDPFIHYGVAASKQAWEGSFDLVFAAMTPAIRTPESFLKLHRASRLGCCFQGWAGKREDPLLEGLWKHLLETSMPSMGWDLTLAFNLLRAMGFSPTIEFHQIGWDRKQPVDKATDFFVDFFRERLSDSPDALREQIVAYLEQTAEDGLVRRKTVGQTGVMTWSVQ